MSQQPPSEAGIGFVFQHLGAHSEEQEEKEQRGFIKRLPGNVTELGCGRVALEGLLLGLKNSFHSRLSPPSFTCTSLKQQAQPRSLNKLAQALSPNAKRCWFQLSSDVFPLSEAFWKCEVQSDMATRPCLIQRPSGWLALGLIFGLT